MVSCPHLLAIDLKKNWTLSYRDLFKGSESILEDVAFHDPSLLIYRETAHSFLLLLNYQQAVLSIHVHIHFSLHLSTAVSLGTLPAAGTHGNTQLQTNKLLSKIIISLIVIPTNTDWAFWLLGVHLPWNFILFEFFWELKCSWMSPRWLVFASAGGLEITPVWVIWCFSDHLGSEIQTISHCEWWLVTNPQGRYLVFTSTPWKVSHRCKPTI